MAEPIRVIWAFQVLPAACAEFMEVYGDSGDWAVLFRQCPGYIRTELVRNTNDPNRFMTIDHWESLACFRAMETSCIREAYQQLDRKCERLTQSEEHLGIFQEIRAPETRRPGT
ncbi:MAG: antibiotic biosynthesis monooxygenase [Desulfobacterales bacterium]|nr:antibiotic biosynthesis monooxygenase [Desulfobacterales bacterium]